jgi:3-methylcrotonyl-CoA carboxylase alpha subunit
MPTTPRFVLRHGDDHLRVEVTGEAEARVGRGPTWHATRLANGDWLVEDGTTRRRVTVAGSADRCQAFVDGEVFDFSIEPEGRPRRGTSRPAPETVSVPMPARVVKIAVTVGDRVRRGDLIMTVEAMKMEMPVKAPRDGTVAAIACREGELVQPGSVLVEIG